MRRPTAAAAAVLAAMLLAAPAHAARSMETQFQDDTLLVYEPPAQLAQTLDTLKGLGVDRIRVSVYWRLVAPNPDSRTPPSWGPGGPTDPASYPAGNWDRYDTVTGMANARGIAVNFNIGGPAPDWAMPPPAKPDLAGHYEPSAVEFGQFVQAVGTRYSGSYAPRSQAAAAPAPGASSKPSDGLLGGILGPKPAPSSAPAPAPAAAASALPRVSYWSIWNEPNQSFFLSPQYVSARGAPHGRAEASPRIYRGLVDQAALGLSRSGHGRDTILIGETAPQGRDSRLLRSSLKPLHFIRRLYCVDDRLRPLRGAYARAEGCPTAHQRTAFPRAHPALFYATGYAHHPYALLTPPAVRSRDRDSVGLADLPKLASTLRRIDVAYGLRRLRYPSVYITEFGYQTKPPDPYGISLGRQAAYLNQAEYIAYRNPNVRSFQQFLLRDSAGNPQYSPRSYLYYGSTFQTGLEFVDGRAKPGLAAFRMPIWIPASHRRRGASFFVWGVVRPAPNGSRPVAWILYRAKGSRRYRTLRRVTVRSYRNVLTTRVRIARSGFVRIAWGSPSGTIVSRAAYVRIGR